MESNSGNKGGRPAGNIMFREVEFNNKQYVVGTIQHNYEDVEFVFDRDDYEKVSNRAWHVSSSVYIASTVYIEGRKKELYLHNLVMGRLEFHGKGQRETVDHINRNGRDNRKENLRVVSQSEQNIHQVKKRRNIVLPANCGISPDEIPKHIWYVNPNGNHGPRFAIEFKTENFVWKGTSSKAVSLQTKLQQAKAKLAECYLEFPHLNPTKEDKLVSDLNVSFDAILDASNTKN